MRREAFLLLAFLGCTQATTQKPPLTAPTEMPRTVLEAICTRLRGEGMSGEIDIVKTTEPLITRETMMALADAAAYHGKKEPAEYAEAFAARPPMPLNISASACELHAVEHGSNVSNDTMLLQLSAPILNPFQRGMAGVFARLSLANEAAQWYWIPLAMRNGVWYAGQPDPISMRR
jgi:hypothetical protein